MSGVTQAKVARTGRGAEDPTKKALPAPVLLVRDLLEPLLLRVGWRPRSRRLSRHRHQTLPTPFLLVPDLLAPLLLTRTWSGAADPTKQALPTPVVLDRDLLAPLLLRGRSRLRSRRLSRRRHQTLSTPALLALDLLATLLLRRFSPLRRRRLSRPRHKAPRPTTPAWEASMGPSTAPST